MKKIARAVHLWIGLLFGTILVVLGLTGSALSWMHELDKILNPGLLQVVAPHGLYPGDSMRVAPALVQSVADMLVRDPRYGQPNTLGLPARAGDVFVATYRSSPGHVEAPWTQAVTRHVMVDPATLRVTGERNWGELGLSRAMLMPTLFHIHRYLVAGEIGKVVVAITGASLLLTILSGLILWWPRMARSTIWKALTVRHGGSWPRFCYQLHRTGGFLVAPVLFVMALSGVYFTMPQWVTPVVNAISPVTPKNKSVNHGGGPAEHILVGAAITAAQQRFPNGRVTRVSFPPKGVDPFEVRMRQPAELRQGPGATRISIDSGNARVLGVVDPQQARGGDKFLSWLFPLHTGEAFGLAGRIFISLFGFVPLAFFTTGLVTWLKLHRGRSVAYKNRSEYRQIERA